MSGQISETPILTALSKRLSRRVDDRDRARARRHLLDWVACAIAGATEPAGQALLSRSRISALDHAFAWGGLGNILEMDDVDKRALLHPGPTIIPAALSVADTQDAAMSDLLTAIVRGYEATIRLGRAVGPGHYAMWHTTGTCGAIGAAAATAHLSALNQDQTAHAMALAISQAAGLWHTRHDAQSMGKQLHTAAAARAGVEASQLASVGFVGPLKILEGEQGFFAAMCPAGDAEVILSDWGEAWVLHQVSFKPWPACRHAHAVIDAALALREQIDLKSADPIMVETYSDAVKFCDRADPKSIIEAKFSLQHSVAVALVRGAPNLEDFSVAAIQDPDLQRVRGRVRVAATNQFDDRYPVRFGSAVAAGPARVVADDALGDPENPISDSQIIDKAQMLMAAGGLSSAQRHRLISDVLESDDCARTLTRQIRECLA